MPYSLMWTNIENTLSLKLIGQMTVDDLKILNETVTKVLESHPDFVSLVVDATQLVSGYHTAKQLQDNLKFMYHARLKVLVVVAEQKLNRFVTLIAFSTARQFYQMRTLADAANWMRVKTIEEVSNVQFA